MVRWYYGYYEQGVHASNTHARFLRTLLTAFYNPRSCRGKDRVDAIDIVNDPDYGSVRREIAVKHRNAMAAQINKDIYLTPQIAAPCDGLVLLQSGEVYPTDPLVSSVCFTNWTV